MKVNIDRMKISDVLQPNIIVFIRVNVIELFQEALYLPGLDIEEFPLTPPSGPNEALPSVTVFIYHMDTGEPNKHVGLYDSVLRESRKQH
jgi:hypothetical protein